MMSHFNEEKLLEGLNDEQKKAVSTTNGPIMIIAGAGTGKTKVITNKIAYLIASQLARPEEILALTFTEKAAEEMKTRIDQVLPYGENSVDVFTFHSFGDLVIKENAFEIGLTPEYKLMNKAEEIYFFKEHLFSFDLNYYRPLSNPTKFIEALLGYFSKLKDEDVTEDSYDAYVSSLKIQLAQGNVEGFDSRDTLEEYLHIQEELSGAFRKYENLKKENAYLNFADLISLSLYILRNKHNIRQYYQNKYKYILVDEYQDTNYTQNEIVKILADKHKNICVCGDDDQSIYKFRGASISNIMKFESTFEGCTNIVLTKNYRSSQTILDAAYSLITQNNPDRLEVVAGINKKLTAQGNISTYKVEAVETQTLIDEMEYISNEIERLKNEDETLQYKDFAILIRSNSQAQPIIRECNTKNIPFKYQGNTGLYETKEIRPLLSLLYALARFDDNINLFNLAASNFYTISMSSLIACNNIARNRTKPLSYVITKIDDFQEELELPEEDLVQIKILASDLAVYREKSREENVGSIILTFLKDKGYIESVSEGITDDKFENIQRFFQRIDRFVTTTNATTINEFCDYIDYTREIGDDPSVEETDTQTDAINILTIHRAKGMEFNTVFMIDLVDGRFPSREMKDPIEVPAALVKEILPKGDFHKQEERRLFYVGMTRAKDRLYMLWAKDYYQKTVKKVSPFVSETGVFATQIQAEKEQIPVIEKKNEIKISFDDPVFSLSQSKIDDYLSCPLKYKYKHEIHLSGSGNFYTFYGTLIHSIIQQILKRDINNNPMPLEEALQQLSDGWKESGFLSQEHIDEAYNNAKKIITGFYTTKSILQPQFIEKKFHIKVGQNFFVDGRWDFIDKNGSIVDFKTSMVKNAKEAKEKVRESTQLKIYAWAYHKLYGELPPYLELYFVSSGIREGFKPNKRTLEAAEKLIQKVYEGVRVKEYSANPSYLACNYCPFNKICPFTMAD